MSGVIFGGKRVKTKQPIDAETFKKVAEKVAEALGITAKEFNQLMADHPRGIYIYKGRGAADPGGGGGGGGGSGGGGGGGG